MKNKWLKFSEDLGLSDRKESQFWISAKLKCNKLVGINLHGETNAMAYEERKIIISAWRKDFHAKIEETEKTPERGYNADQTGLYYKKLPNSVYVDESNKKYYSGVKQLKYKTHFTLMVVTPARKKVPMSVVGKPKIQNASNLWMDQGHSFHTKTKQILGLIKKSHDGGF